MTFTEIKAAIAQMSRGELIQARNDVAAMGRRARRADRRRAYSAVLSEINMHLVGIEYKSRPVEGYAPAENDMSDDELLAQLGL